MIYVTIAPDPTRKKQVMECKKVAFALSSSLLRDLRAASPDGQIRNGLIEDAISEGWMRWQDGAPLPKSSSPGSVQAIQCWISKDVVEMAQEAKRATKGPHRASLAVAIRRLLILGLEER
jgi:hypothetical protein